jgi:hypothetical protein
MAKEPLYHFSYVIDHCVQLHVDSWDGFYL